MNRLVVSSVMKRGVTGGGFNSSLAAAATPFDVFGAGMGLSVGWRLLMSSATAPSSSGTEMKGSRDVELEKVEKGGISSYWGITRPKITREDGTEWVWNYFMPWETYQSNLSVDLNKHHVPKKFIDKVAYRTVKLLRIPTDIFFKRRYGCRAMMLETVAAVPGMVGGMLLHLRALHKFQQSGGWIKALLEEAENERMHLITMVELVQPSGTRDFWCSQFKESSSMPSLYCT